MSARLIDDGVGRREEGRRRRRRANSQQRSTQGPKDGRRRHCPTPDEDSPTKRGIKCLVFFTLFYYQTCSELPITFRCPAFLLAKMERQSGNCVETPHE